ncbi:unnamed protein product [Thlaspi arvense]|uniref:FBD domain-containing protein n=1 Tax=Thlaspi arvense TaxID=13288 RepID=A0AAU9SIQ3_THLAR|nr:unnamed protein product [Thlaspi arvense]
MILRKQGVVNEDMISKLSEALLLQILSCLPIKVFIATSVLSKRWRTLWKLVPKLEFESTNHQKFSENVGRFLLSHKAPVLESLHLKFFHNCRAIDIGLWAGIAFARNLREFVLDHRLEAKIKFPSSLFSFNNTLVTLKLKNSVLVDVQSPVCMKSLRTLHLHCVDFGNNASFRNIISGCPNLENLVMCRDYPKNDLTFFIVAPSLKRLSIKDYTGVVKSGGYTINAPSLQYLRIRGISHSERCFIENAPELVEANISNVSPVINERFLISLKSAKRLLLDLSPLEVMFPTGAIFYRLVYLEMYTHKLEWWNLLALMLDSSPKLQALKLIDQSQKSDKDCVVGGKWNQPKDVPECLLSHLETFVWTIYNWDREEEIEVATYILRNARRLKNATISTRPIQYKELSKLEERYKMLMELDGVVRASNSCHLDNTIEPVWDTYGRSVHPTCELGSLNRTDINNVNL